MTGPSDVLVQLRDLIDIANQRHWHDAEQWLRERVEAAEDRMARGERR
jgi:hypothetical protein